MEASLVQIILSHSHSRPHQKSKWKLLILEIQITSENILCEEDCVSGSCPLGVIVIVTLRKTHEG